MPAFLPLVAILGRLGLSLAAQTALAAGMQYLGDEAEQSGWDTTANILHHPFMQGVLPGVMTGGVGTLTGAVKGGGLAGLRNPGLVKDFGRNSLGEVKAGLLFEGGMPLVGQGIKSVGDWMKGSPDQMSDPQLQSGFNPYQGGFFNEEAFDPRYLQYYQISPSMQAVSNRYRQYQNPLDFESEFNPYEGVY